MTSLLILGLKVNSSSSLGVSSLSRAAWKTREADLCTSKFTWACAVWQAHGGMQLPGGLWVGQAVQGAASSGAGTRGVSGRWNTLGHYTMVYTRRGMNHARVHGRPHVGVRQTL